jgi:hypothetical protein
LSSRSRLDLLINALVLMRRASGAIDSALGLPARDRAEVEENLDRVRRDLNHVTAQLAASIPGGATLGKRPELRAAAGVVEFVARQGAAQLGAVAGVADSFRKGGDSRSLANQIERHLAEVGVASREELGMALGVDPDSERLREGIERALGTGRAEWYAPDVYGVARGRLEDLAEPADGALDEPPASEAEVADLRTAVDELETSLTQLGTQLREAESDEQR